jgi:SAM-dependent methyltransferase
MIHDLPLPLVSFEDFKSFDSYRRSHRSAFHHTMARDIDFIQDADDYLIDAFCVVCDQPRKMHVSKHLSFVENGLKYPLWRETVTCTICALNNRMRGLLHLMVAEAKFAFLADIYFTEQITGTFKAALKNWPNAIGSEYLRDGTPRGQTNSDGIRCEDMTQMTFDDASFDGFVTMDVIEHVPDYKTALKEAYRVLRPGGRLVLSAPFNLDIDQSLIRALILPSGEIRHLMEPEYHGDPLDPNGLLCFTTFGWDFLVTLREIGFQNPTMNFYWSDRFGYLGIQYFILAERGGGRP